MRSWNSEVRSRNNEGPTIIAPVSCFGDNYPKDGVATIYYYSMETAARKRFMWKKPVNFWLHKFNFTATLVVDIIKSEIVKLLTKYVNKITYPQIISKITMMRRESHGGKGCKGGKGRNCRR